MTARARRRALAAALSLAPLLLGGTCGGGPGGGGGGPAPAAVLTFAFDASNLRVGVPVQVSVMATTTAGTLQAFDIDVQVSPKKAVLHSAAPGADFDDDGGLFRPSVNAFATGEIRGIVDVRHGPSALAGAVEIARFTLLPLKPAAGQWVEFTSAALADPQGRAFEVTAIGTPILISE